MQQLPPGHHWEQSASVIRRLEKETPPHIMLDPPLSVLQKGVAAVAAASSAAATSSATGKPSVPAHSAGFGVSGNSVAAGSAEAPRHSGIVMVDGRGGVDGDRPWHAHEKNCTSFTPSVVLADGGNGFHYSPMLQPAPALVRSGSRSKNGNGSSLPLVQSATSSPVHADRASPSPNTPSDASARAAALPAGTPPLRFKHDVAPVFPWIQSTLSPQGVDAWARDSYNGMGVTVPPSLGVPAVLATVNAIKANPMPYIRPEDTIVVLRHAAAAAAKDDPLTRWSQRRRRRQQRV